MDKIKNLLKKIGASDELAAQLCEELERYDKQVMAKYEKIYQAKLDQAKKICIEEVQKYKIDLAQKVKIFLEGKSNQIEKRLDQLRAAEEGEAKALLRKVKEITEGIEVADDAELRALREKIEKLEVKNAQLMEERKKALIAADRANKIALDIIEKSKMFIKEGQKEDEQLEIGPKDAAGKKGDKEEAKKTAGCELAGTEEEDEEEGTVKESRSSKIRAILKEKIKQAKPQTTRRTPVELQTAPTAQTSSTVVEADTDILRIANSI